MEARSLLKIRLLVGLVTIGAVSGVPRVARAVHSDILVVQDSQGKLVTGIADIDHSDLSAPSRLFHRELDSTFFGSDPGFNAVSPVNVPDGYLALSADTPLAFDFAALSLHLQSVSNLWYWDGIDDNGNGNLEDDVDFLPAVATTFTAKLTPFSALVDGAAADVPGFNIQTTSDTGAMHRHLNFQLAGGPAGTPLEGLYLVSMRMRMNGLARSDPLYIVFATDGAVLSLGYPAAVSWADDHLLIPGDVNNDAMVDIFDVNGVSAHWGEAGPAGDANYDGTVDIFDVNLISAHWGATATGAVALSVAEPATGMLFGAGLLAFCVIRAAAHRRG